MNLAEWCWNRYRNDMCGLHDTLQAENHSFASTPIRLYSGAAREAFGRWSAHRAAMVATISVIIGDGSFDDHTRAGELVDQWMQQDWPTSSVVSQLREYARAREV
jgi:hypothetical protein